MTKNSTHREEAGAGGSRTARAGGSAPGHAPAPAQMATVTLLRAADCVRRRLATVFEPHGITGQQYNVLRIMRGAQPELLPTLEIGKRMMEQTPGVTRLVDRLEAKGLVRRERSTDDRRVVHCAITEAGLALLDALDEEVDAANRAAMAGVDPQELRNLTELLESVCSGIR